MVTTLGVVVLTLLFHFSLAPLYTYFWSLFIVANLFAFAFTGFLYVKGRRIQRGDIQPQPLSKIFRDVWFGLELNPTWMGVDLKMFAYQPSLIGLGLLNASFAYVQYEKYGEIKLQMWMFQLCWWLYLATHYYYEEFMLSTWDITAKKFGFMLVWGDLVLVPFFYSIVGWYLVDAIAPTSLSTIVAISLLYLVGLTIFRDANAQKHRFKKNPEAKIWGQPAQALEGKLLISGWWGIGCKLNYTGEICVYFALALTAGFDSIIPYLLPLWLCVLLPHRAWRDEQRCQTKYGNDNLWNSYCARVRFRMLPFMY
jgi:delta14-sterol reductase